MSILKNKQMKNSKYYSLIQKWNNRKHKTRSLSKQFVQKGSNFRKTIACLLRLWKTHKSLVAISKLYDINKKQLSIVLVKYSKIFKNRKNHHYGRKMLGSIEWKRSKKGSAIRNKIALFLKTWKRVRSIKEVAKILKTKRSLTSELLKKSNAYTNRRKYSRQEAEYAYTWALKLMAIKTLGGKCTKCGNSNIVVLELHHKDKREKEKCFSDMTRKSSNFKAIKKEIMKCKLYCRNCHQELHNKNKHTKNLKNKKFVLRILNNNGQCKRCGYNNNISCLEFHHKKIANKKFQISMLTDPRRNYSALKISKEKLKTYINEIKKCEALCCNCHQIEHTKIDKLRDLRLLIETTARLINCGYQYKLNYRGHPTH